YRSIRIDLKYPDGLLSLGTFKMNVYHAFTFDSPSCEIAKYAGIGRSTGLNLNLLSTDLVQNPQDAINGNATTHSSISFGNLAISVASSVFQDFYFAGLSAPQDYFKVKLKLGGSALNLNVLGNYEVRAYNGTQLVYTKKLQGALVNGLDLL